MTAYRFIDAEKARHTVRMICRVIGVSRAASGGTRRWRRTQMRTRSYACTSAACTARAAAPTGARA